MKTTILCFLILIIAVTMSAAHGGKKHKKDSPKTHTDSTKIDEDHEHASDTIHHHDGEITPDESKVRADLDDFPSLHPLIVHLAIVLILVAAALQLLNLWLMKREISWIITGILFHGVLIAWLAATNFHPHTDDLSEHAQSVLDQHDYWADWTINFGIVALLLQIANLFFFQTKRWAFATVAAVLLLSGYSVAQTAHYGAQLVHIEGVGPQGHHLELDHHQ